MENNERPLVTAIITTYKREPTLLSRAIESVLSQTYTNLELIVVDDSPADYEYRADVKTLCEGYGARLRYIPHATNQGACAARNTGIDAANGELIAFLDDDDEWLPTKIEKQQKLFISDKIGLVYCDNYIVDEISERVYEEKKRCLQGDIFDALMIKNYIGSTSLPLLRFDAVLKVGKFDIKMPASQDYDLWLRIAERYAVSYVNEPLVNYFIHNGEQITKSNDFKRDARTRIINKYKDYLQKHPKVYAVKLALLARSYICDDRKMACKILLKSFLRYPFPHKALLKTALMIVFTRKTKGE